MADKQRDAGKEQSWRKVLARQDASRLSAAEFCRREGLSQPSFYAWRRTIAERDRAKRSTPRQPVPGFLPVQLSDAAPRGEASIVIELAGGQVLRLSEATPAVRIAELVRALEETRR